MSRRFIFWLAINLLALFVADAIAAAAAPVRLGAGPAAGGAWRSGGPWNESGQPIVITAVAASPTYANDATLFAAGNGRGYGSLYRSTDGGQHWAEIFYPTPPGPYSGGWFRQVAVASPASGPAAIVFASYNGNLSPTAQSPTVPQAPYGTLYRSTDRGESWDIALARMQIGPFVLSPAFGSDHTLFVMVEGTLNRSTDGGSTWQPLPFPTTQHPLDVFNLAISPAFTADHTLFAGGYGPTQRSTDAGLTWQALPGYNPSYALAISPAFSQDRALWSAYRVIEGVGDGAPESGIIRSTNGGATWHLTSIGLPGDYEPFPASLGVSPGFANDRSLFTALRGQFLGWDQHSLFRSYDGGESWVDLGPAPANPNDLAIAVTRAEAEGVVAHVATERGVWEYGGACEERLVNGGFETDAAWSFPNTPYPAGYNIILPHSGHRSLRAGIIDDADVRSYSSARQTLTIPAGLSNATLSLWWRPLSEESGVILAAADLQAIADGDAPANALDDDAQYILLLDQQGSPLRTLAWERSNAAVWQTLSFDLSAYTGRTVQLHIGVFNDGDGKKTALYADDVSLVVCWPATPTPRAYLPMLLRTFSHPPAPTPTPIPPPACYDGLHNGGFETSDAWLIKDNPAPADYVATPVHSGSRAMRTGITPGGANLRSYSPIEQTITIPAGVSSARLRFWRYRLWGDSALAMAPPPSFDLPTTEADLPNAALDTDFFYVLAIRANGALVWLLIERINDPAWREADLDLRSLAGQTTRLQFGTYNTGAGGSSTTYVDDARLTLCPPPAARALPSN